MKSFCGCMFFCYGLNLFGVVWNERISCKDDSGNLVDFWYAYKLPRNETHTNENVAQGVAYTFLLSSDAQVNDWTLSQLGIGDAQSMMGRTLAPVYAQPRQSDLGFVLYNDEFPNGMTSFTKGHSKGVLVLNQEGGYWIVQSVPRYPPWADSPYGYPPSGHNYGQSLVCITINVDQAEKIGKQLQYSLPNVYNYSMPSWTQQTLPTLFDAVVNSKHATSAPWFSVLDITSAGGSTFVSFSKHTRYGKDVYGDLLAPTLQSDLEVETWHHGSDKIPSTCSSFDVKNVANVYVGPLQYSFNNSYDHSKWAVAPENAINPWTCIGDNNRMVSQEARAGLTLCQRSTKVWSAYSKSVAGVESCHGP